MSVTDSNRELGNPFAHDKYVVKRQFFKLLGGSFRFFTEDGNLVMFGSMKAFKLKEDIRLYTDESKSNELLTIKARNIVDLSSAYDVYDSKTNAKIGALRRRGLRSIIKDQWIIMDDMDNEIGTIEEDSWILAIIRRQITSLVPQRFDGSVRGTSVFKFTQHFNPFVVRMTLDFSLDTNRIMDRRLGIAAAVLLTAIEGRQG